MLLASKFYTNMVSMYYLIPIMKKKITYFLFCNRRQIGTNVVSLNPAHGQVYSIKHYVIKFVSDLIQVCGFRRVLRFLPPIKLITTRYNLNIVESGTIILTLHFQFAFCYKTKSKLFFFSLLESGTDCIYIVIVNSTTIRLRRRTLKGSAYHNKNSITLILTVDLLRYRKILRVEMKLLTFSNLTSLRF
jgi:hypothetical protein